MRVNYLPSLSSVVLQMNFNALLEPSIGQILSGLTLFLIAVEVVSILRFNCITASVESDGENADEEEEIFSDEEGGSSNSPPIIRPCVLDVSEGEEDDEEENEEEEDEEEQDEESESASSITTTPTTPSPIITHFACAICTDNVCPSKNVSVTKCGHMFHSECIAQWLNETENCPHCRALCQPDMLVRVYMNGSADRIPAQREIERLQNEVRCIQEMLRERDEDLEAITDAHNEAQKQISDLKAHVEQTLSVLHVSMKLVSKHLIVDSILCLCFWDNICS